MKRALQRALPIAVSLAVLVWLLRSVDLTAVAASLSARVALVLVPSLLVYGAATLWLEAASLSGLVHESPGLPRWTAARIKCASYLVAILNYALGVGAVVVLLRRQTGLSLARAASLVILISTTDLVVVLGLAAIGAAQAGTGAPTLRGGIVAVAVVGLFGGLALLRMPRSLGPLERIRSLSAFEALRNVPLPDLGRLFALRVAFSICFVAVCGAVFVAFRVVVPLPDLVAGVFFVAVVAAVPIAVAGLGTSQAAFLYFFSSYAPEATLLAMSLILSAGLVALRAGMGVAFAREFTREALRETREPVL
ncbi:MAG TPA: lysylphosphatidylglycerol synthase domain-containing protein [Myxococcota bacterium]|nr:lysylphosphatidylglycerol synthase domain-containing protein [Myxococcota bacterium]